MFSIVIEVVYVMKLRARALGARAVGAGAGAFTLAQLGADPIWRWCHGALAPLARALKGLVPVSLAPKALAPFALA
ncbi:unnamed protein product [Closterium sp. Naga37s-1]|nr:unnamed protein product [Closterium sp. Naga37s-1]